jgi:hypothetical protein
MDTHRITSQPWQLKAAAEGTIGAIVLPLVPQPELMPKSVRTYDDYWTWKSSPVNLIALMWGKDELPGAFLIDRLLYQKGDRIYLAEKWCKCDWGASFDDDIYFVESATPEAEHIGWQPAETMPEEAAQYWFEITEVRVVQIKHLGPEVFDLSGLYPNGVKAIDPLDIFDACESAAQMWNAAHPDYPWDADRWVIVLKVLQSNGDDVPFPRLFDSVEY